MHEAQDAKGAVSLKLEVEEIEKRERGRPSCTSSTTSDLCTCRCQIIP